jgi:hypothetical protein
MKNIKFILTILNLILFLFIYLTINENKNSDINSKHLEINDLSDLHNIEITNSVSNLKLNKIDHNWMIIEPKLWDCDRFAISNFITIFSHLKFKELFSPKELIQRGEIFSDYGFDDNVTKLTINKLTSRVTIKIGKKTRDNKAVYCLIKLNEEEESETIWRVSKEITEIISYQFEDWADRKIIKSNLYSIDELSISFRSNKNLINQTTIKKSLNNWNFHKPFKSQANNDMVRFTINKLLTEQVINHKIDDSDYIFTEDLENNWTLKLEILNSGKIEAFWFSDSIKTDSETYRLCKTSHSPHAIKVSDSIAEILSNWSTKLRERKIFKLKKNEIKSIRITSHNNEYTLVRTPKNSWSINHKKDGLIVSEKADEQSIIELISSLNKIDVKEFISFNTIYSELENDKSLDTVYNLVIQKNDTTIKTLFISNNEQDASLWKTYIIEDSLLCLVENDWSEILSNEFFQFKDKQLIDQVRNLIISDVITIKEKKRVILDSNVSSELSLSLNSSRIQNYINNNATHEGTWIDGDWVPWLYEVKLTDNDKIHINSLLLSEVFNQGKCYGTFSDNNLSFKLKDETIKVFSKALGSAK